MAHPNGRTEFPLDWSKIAELCIAGCSGREIAGYFGINPDTIYERCKKDLDMTFTHFSAQYQAKGETLLRAKQFDKAIKGDNTLLIWLGKNRLKQMEKEHADVADLATQLKELSEYIKGTRGITSGNIESNLSSDKPLLHQRLEGEQDKVPTQLGSESITDGSTPI